MKRLQNCFFFALFLFSGTVMSQTVGDLKFELSSIKGTDGFFRVGKTTEGQWWFLTPDNEPFFYKGVCAVNRAGTQGGRRAISGPYATTIDEKYGYQQSPDKFVDASIMKIHDLGFNALGAWATEEFFDRGIPFTEIIEFFKEGPFLPSVEGTKALPDIFNPQWLVAIDRKTRSLCSPLRNSKDLVGYFTDNEIGFGNADDLGLDLGFQSGQFDFALLRLVLGMNEDEPASVFAWKFLFNRHEQSLAKLSADWQVVITSKNDVRKLNDTKAPITTKSFAGDAQAFVELYAQRYFELANQAIRRYDPNHLILGCRFGAPPPTYVLDAIKPWTDVISANNYQPILYERYDTVYQYTGLPILIGEFSWNTDLYKKVPFPGENLVTGTLKERMFLRGTETLKRMAEHPGIVGYTWYRWVQGTSTANRFFDGIVNYGDSLEIHCGQLGKLNPELDKIRYQAESGNWKDRALSSGEMTLFFNQLRPDWTQYLRFELKGGKPINSAYGWMMIGKIAGYKETKNGISFKMEITFEAIPSVKKSYEAGSGTYLVKLTRLGEKFYGNFEGTYNGKPISGTVKAFYFPEIELNK